MQVIPNQRLVFRFHYLELALSELIGRMGGGGGCLWALAIFYPTSHPVGNFL